MVAIDTPSSYQLFLRGQFHARYELMTVEALIPRYLYGDTTFVNKSNRRLKLLT